MITRTPRMLRRALAGTAALALALSLTSTAGAAADNPAPVVSDAGRPIGGVTSSTLTLITGDTVAVTTQPDGKQAVDIVAPTGASDQFDISTGPTGSLYVYPEDALPAVEAGIVDAELFNVTRILAESHGDSVADDVHAILDFQGEPSATAMRQRADALPSSATERVMPRLGLAAVAVDKATARNFWQSVKPATRTSRSGSSTLVPGTAGVAKLWYDGQVRVTLDRSTAQIGAPEAWAKGYDGSGIKVAVLDTGADLGHPDIASKVVAGQSFVAGESVQDGHGHGTHVASTIAGTGAASGGKYRGVAPGAGLLIGKVLDNSGHGPQSGILAGMDWAVAQGADIVSMSLGQDYVTPGGDALTRAVDRLSNSSDTLFVIAAGNSGPGSTTIGSPGAAETALTVGAVDRSDMLADFSSRGPRLGDNGIKPDITAPGVGIVAARAAGTAMGTPADAGYTAASGTSMATPHVAGAAAILAQRHPDWTGRQLKEDLTGHAKVADSQTVYQQGFGRVDIPAALEPTLGLSGKADFGLIEWTPGRHPTESRAVTLHNSASTDAALSLTVEVVDGSNHPVADGVVSLSGEGLSDGRLTVPAGGSAVVDVVLDPNDLPDSTRYSGYLRVVGDGTSVHAPIGFSTDVQRHNVTVNFADRFGAAPAGAKFTVHGMDNRFWQAETLSGTGSKTYSLPVGKYSIEGRITTSYPGGTGGSSYALDMFALPNVTVGEADQTLTVDGRTATDFTMTVNGERRPLERGVYMTTISRDGDPNTYAASFLATANLLNGNEQRIGAIPSEAATTGTLALYNFITQRQPLADLTAVGRRGADIPVTVPLQGRRFATTTRARLVDGGSGSAEDLAGRDVAGQAVLISIPNLTAADEPAKRAAAAGAAAVIIAPATPSGLTGAAVSADLTVPAVAVSYSDGHALLAELATRRTDIELKNILESGYTYSAQFAENGRIPASMAKSVSTREFATVRNTFHSDRIGHLGVDILNAWFPAQGVSLRVGQPVYAGRSRDDHVLAKPDLTYQQMVGAGTDDGARMDRAPVIYGTPGKTYQEHWFAAPTHVGTYEDGPCNFCRSDVWTRVVAPLTDGEPTHRLTLGPAPRWTFYRNGQVVDATKVTVPEMADYRFVADVNRAKDIPGVTLAGTVSTEWNFRSAAPTTMAVKDCDQYIPKPTTCAALPVVMVGYDMPVDTFNQLRAGRSTTFTVTGGRAKGWTGPTAMAGARVRVSYDDGATWRDTDVRRVGSNSFQVGLKIPHLTQTNGYLTLKTEVWDYSGSRTTQTIRRAQALS